MQSKLFPCQWKETSSRLEGRVRDGARRIVGTTRSKGVAIWERDKRSVCSKLRVRDCVLCLVLCLKVTVTELLHYCVRSLTIKSEENQLCGVLWLLFPHTDPLGVWRWVVLPRQQTGVSWPCFCFSRSTWSKEMTLPAWWVRPEGAGAAQLRTARWFACSHRLAYHRLLCDSVSFSHQMTDWLTSCSYLWFLVLCLSEGVCSVCVTGKKNSCAHRYGKSP